MVEKYFNNASAILIILLIAGCTPNDKYRCVSNTPRFEDYPAEKFDGNPTEIDFARSPGAWQFRSRLREEVALGPNFAGAYVIVKIGCGTNCRTAWIVNAKNGKAEPIIGRFTEMYSKEEDFRVNSKLLIARSGPDPVYEQFLDYYIWDGNKLIPLIFPLHVGSDGICD